jgi:hypothetical protein
MSSDFYRIVYDEENDCLERIREISPDGKYCIYISLPVDEAGFRASLPYAEAICDNIVTFLEKFELFKAEEREKYLRKYYKPRWFRAKQYLEWAEEISKLVIDQVYFPSRDHPDYAEISCKKIPGSWRDWHCGYENGHFFDLFY